MSFLLLSCLLPKWLSQIYEQAQLFIAVSFPKNVVLIFFFYFHSIIFAYLKNICCSIVSCTSPVSEAGRISLSISSLSYFSRDVFDAFVPGGGISFRFKFLDCWFENQRWRWIIRKDFTARAFKFNEKPCQPALSNEVTLIYGK